MNGMREKEIEKNQKERKREEKMSVTRSKMKLILQFFIVVRFMVVGSCCHFYSFPTNNYSLLIIFLSKELDNENINSEIIMYNNIYFNKKRKRN
jgi:hypothetical protein